MPFSLRVEPETGIVIATCTGALALADAKKGAAAFWENPEWGGRPIVWDFRSARLDVTGAEVREMAQFILENQPQSPPSRVAFVTSSDADFGLGRMFEVLREHPSTQVRVFRDYAEAVSWARSSERPALDAGASGGPKR